MKIQETTIVDVFDQEAVVSITLAGHKDLEQANEFVIVHAYVPHEPGLSLEEIQLRALGRAVELVEKQSAELSRKLPGS